MVMGINLGKKGRDRSEQDPDQSHEGDIDGKPRPARQPQIGPVAAFKSAVVVDRLPKTRSGKILRGTIAKIADGAPWNMPATVDDPVIFDEITESLSTIGYPK